jgi:hypothetical protein
MQELPYSQSERWRTALRLVSRERLTLSASVLLEADRLTVTLSNGRSFSAPRTWSDESAIAAAIQWSQRHGAGSVTVIR